MPLDISLVAKDLGDQHVQALPTVGDRLSEKKCAANHNPNI